MENWKRIYDARWEMNRTEVYAILGPPGDYRTTLTTCWERDGAELIYGSPAKEFEEFGLELETWQGAAGNLYVMFSPEGIDSVAFAPAGEPNRHPLDNLVWRIKRQWRRWSR